MIIDSSNKYFFKILATADVKRVFCATRIIENNELKFVEPYVWGHLIAYYKDDTVAHVRVKGSSYLIPIAYVKRAEIKVKKENDSPKFILDGIKQENKDLINSYLNNHSIIDNLMFQTKLNKFLKENV